MISYKVINWGYLLILSLLSFIYCAEFLSAINESEMYNQTVYRIVLLAIYILTISVFWVNLRYILTLINPIITAFLSLLFFISFNHLVQPDLSLSVVTALFRGLSLTLPLIVLVVVYSIFRKNDYRNILPQIFLFILIGFSILYYLQFNVIKEALEVDNKSFNSSYVPLFALPLVLLSKKKWLKISGIVIITFIVFSSNKRGGFIAYSIALLVYFFLELEVNRKNKLKIVNYLAVCFFAVIGGIVFSYYAEKNDGFFLYRLEKLSTDDGSGRTEIYNQVLDGIGKSNIFEFLIGHGDNAVSSITVEKLPAHNDFLEVMYDYGFIAFCIYSYIHYLFIKFGIKLKRQKKHFVSSWFFTYLLFFMMSMISHVIIYQYFILLVIYWGIVMGTYEREKNNEDEYQQSLE
jgi:hypothetical protein